MLGLQSCTFPPVTLDFITFNKLLAEHDKRRERTRSLDYQTSLSVIMRTANIDNILGWTSSSGIQVQSCLLLLHVLRESLKEVVQRQTEDHCSSLPHTSWPKVIRKLMNTINKEK